MLVYSPLYFLFFDVASSMCSYNNVNQDPQSNNIENPSIECWKSCSLVSACPHITSACCKWCRSVT